MEEKDYCCTCEWYAVEEGVCCKSTLEDFFLSLVGGWFPNDFNLSSAHSSILTRSLYDGVLEIINDPVEYTWHEIFPNVEIQGTNAKETTVNLERNGRFKTWTFRSIDGSLTGATRCNRILTADDLVSGIEEALNKNRLDTLWTKVVNDLRSRRLEGCKEFYIATRWSVHDPIGKLQQLYAGNPRARFIAVPALDENGKSNFLFTVNGFSEKYFNDAKESMDEISYNCLYQQQPVEREGLLLPPDKLKRFFFSKEDVPDGCADEYIIIPDKDADAIWAVCDTKDKGTDFESLPIAYQYGDKFFFPDVVFDDTTDYDIYAKGFLAKRALDVLTSPVESAMNYVETLNYFNSAFNQVAEGIDTDEWKKSGIKSAEAYANSFQERAKQLSQKLTGFNISDTGEMTRTNTASLGLDPEKTMQYQATFAQMASSMGDTSETALKLSNALTMIGADLASVRNMDFEDVWQDMASGLTGMSRAMDKYGINIRNANMQQELYNLGINTSISNLSQADKTILRTIILLNNSKYAWADLSNTINQPANQIRMLQANFASLGRTIGSLFIPILQTVLPYINAIVIALQRMFAYIAKLLGIKLSNFVSSTGGISVNTGDIADNMDNASGAIDNANTSAKKLEKTLSVLSFDELNQLNDNSDSGSTSNPSSGSGGGASHLPALDAALDDALSAYQKAWDEAFKKMSNRANEMADAIVNAFKRKDWKGLGKIMADGINWGMQKLYDFINWNNVGPYITKFTSAFTQTFNSLVDNINWDLMGRTVGAGINTIVNTANQLLEGTNFKNLGKKFAEGITGLVREVDWTNFGNMLGNNFMKAWDVLTGFVENLPYSEIGQSVATGLNGIFEKVDFGEIAHALATGLNGAFDSLDAFTETFDWNELVDNITNGIVTFMQEFDWKENGQKLENFINHLLTSLIDIAEGMESTTTSSWGNSSREATLKAREMKNAVSTELGNMDKSVTSHFQSQYNIAYKKWENIGRDISSYISKDMNNKIGSSLNSVVDTIKSKFAGLYNVGKNAMQELSNGMKSVHISTPHMWMNMNASTSGNHYSYNWNSGVNWYAKGGLFKNASVIGVGEAGQEAVLPLENRKAMKSIADSIMSGYDGNMGLTKDEIMEAVERGVVTALMNNGGFGGSSPEYIMNSIKVNERELARIVTKAQNNTDYRMNPSPVY